MGTMMTWAETVAAELAEAEAAQEAYREWLHESGSCGGGWCYYCDGEAELAAWERDNARDVAERHAEDLHNSCGGCGKLSCRCEVRR